MTPREQQIVELYKKLGNNCAVARELGIHESTVRGALRRASEDPGIRQALERTGLSSGNAKYGWRRVQDPESGSWDSVFWKAPEDSADFIERLRDAFESLTPAPAITPPESVAADLCTVYPLMDVHFGMLADKDETGVSDYDIKRATADMRHAFAKIGALTPASAKAILIVGGDFFHADDNRNETPANRHKLDVDSRYSRTLRAGVDIVAHIIDNLAIRHASVTACVIRGNHDEHSHEALSIGLEQRYRLSDHVNVSWTPRGLFMAQWGKCLIAAHHGDKAPPERLTLTLSDICPFWSDTRHRYCFTGHIHKDMARDVGPLRWESLRAFAPPDAYAAGMGYTGRRAMQALTFHKRDGLVLRAIDPIER